jgi:invasion protein IalB
MFAMQVVRFPRLIVTVAAVLMSAAAMAQTPPAAAPAQAPASDAAGAQQQAPQQPQQNNPFSVVQPVGSWTVRCAQVTVKSPAPCEMLQVRADPTSKKPVLQFSIAYVPSRDAYAFQIITLNGVALARGLTLAAGDHSLNAAKFTRCEQNYCFVELLADTAMVNALQNMGKETTVTVYAYGSNKEFKYTVPLTGFAEAVDRVKTFARDRAVNAAATGAVPAAAKTPAKAARGKAPAAP